MGEPHACSHTTPSTNRFTMFEDSGYLTNTPESTDSVRTLSRFGSGKSPSRLQDSLLYTPEPAGPKFERNEPFPNSSEESRAIDALSEQMLNWGGRGDCFQDRDDDMCVDKTEECGEVYVTDPLDASLYHEDESLSVRAPKQARMETMEDVDRELLHPNSENEDWECVEVVRRKSASLDTPTGQRLFLRKLAVLKDEPAAGWRDRLRAGGHRYAHDFSGKNTVDFLSLLGVHSSHPSVVGRILGHLQPGDLEACTRVSKAWQGLINQDRVSTARLHRHRRRLVALKENRAGKASGQSARRLGPLAAINNLSTAPPSPPPPSPPPKTRYQECVELERAGTVVAMCPRCRGPAGVLGPEAECRDRACSMVFCTACRLASHLPRPCLYATGRRATKRGAVGSKESRRNLRRLLEM